ncbi:trehalose-6-phosphate hydrolase [Chromobacterium alkanivorans]|uniref:alpha,alpha-phosphotrehalase n=1 Tax=Chromobacterium alkanivorans TaxID=1071719 RepID=UPI002168B9C2|nr:alpha,alpha-phosphotrehalase [Chromobacterium alkanivorans]MCS3804910.1 trehalose-6-phosphate hydrolase [Chromobacterium alkanivorans]MCS3819527.1 trehalose-6-phosphate hydrolase [Chromobacterium alkanivorans]MCS3874039.1 trehalose-6-phosphate hydrolase [Chromobacterium alkanivorans]
MNKNLKSAVVYQIYPKSFYSHHGAATGDLLGVADKLDYLAWLGVDYLWLTPFYRSPQRDNGYDVSDYYAIDPAYGSMADFELLLAEARLRGIGVMLDIVVNHTSTEHPWFRQALQGRDNPYRDFYIWRDRPNNWRSKFGGSAWEWDEASGQYYLHLFDKTQADLNWDNPAVRRAVFDMMNFWADKGVAGFRLDVINLISKDPAFSEDDSDGRHFYTDGPRVHEYLQQMHREVFAGRDLMTVGEMSSTSLEHCVAYSHPERRELSMTFNFHHLKVDYPDGEKWRAAPFDFIALKRILSDWQRGMHEGGGWNALFWCNHDQPRVVSRFGDDGRYRVESAKMLASTLHGLQGTPYIYQGEEIGMANPGFADIEDYRDVETHNAYRQLLADGLERGQAMAAIRQKSRDNSRTPMQWDDGRFAGFSRREPWIGLAPDAETVNVAAARRDPDSVLQHYRRLIALRKQYPIFSDGDYRCLTPDDPALWVYARTGEREKLLVISNFSAEERDYSPPAEYLAPNHGWQLLCANYADAASHPARARLRPYESLLYRAVLN